MLQCHLFSRLQGIVHDSNHISIWNDEPATNTSVLLWPIPNLKSDLWQNYGGLVDNERLGGHILILTLLGHFPGICKSAELTDIWWFWLMQPSTWTTVNGDMPDYTSLLLFRADAKVYLFWTSFKSPLLDLFTIMGPTLILLLCWSFYITFLI